jgi:hypothetical protein
MSQFVYVASLPGLQKIVNLTELNFIDYKHLVKNILNGNNRIIHNAFNHILKSNCQDDISEATFLDKLIILLTIRAVCISPVLEFTIENPENKHPYNLSFEVTEIIDKINTIKFFNNLNNLEVEYNDLKITYGIPSNLYYDSVEASLFSSIKKIKMYDQDITDQKQLIFDKLPAAIYKDAKDHVKKIKAEINKVALLSVNITKKEKSDIEIMPDVFNNSTLDFLSLCYKKDLVSLYEMEYFLTSKLHIPFEILKSSTFAELMIYINFYNDEKKREQQSSKQSSSNPMAPKIG